MKEYTLYSYNDYISEMFGNMPDEDFDKWLKIFNRYIRALRANSNDVCIAQMDNEEYYEYAPRELFSGTNYKVLDADARLYCMDEYCVVDEIFGTCAALWFKTEDEATKYLGMVESGEVSNLDSQIEEEFDLDGNRITKSDADEVTELAKDICEFYFDSDYYGFVDASETGATIDEMKEDAIRDIINDISNEASRKSVKKALEDEASVCEDEEDDVMYDTVVSLLKRLEALG